MHVIFITTKCFDVRAQLNTHIIMNILIVVDCSCGKMKSLTVLFALFAVSLEAEGIHFS